MYLTFTNRIAFTRCWYKGIFNPKTLLAMKLLTLLLFIASMQVSARGHAQVTLAEKIPH
jgi:hypothetical protein